MAEEYGTIGITPDGEWSSSKPYNLLKAVEYNGSSYLAKKEVPAGVLPTDKSYWQTLAQGGNKATADALGVVKPDNTTITVDGNGTISAKKATTSAPGIVKPASTDFTVAADGTEKINTAFTQAATLANIAANEAWLTIVGKISKSIATTMGLDQNALRKNMLSSVDVNDTNKVPTSALSYAHAQRIGMAEALEVGNNLTDAVNQLNSDLTILNGTSEIITGNNSIILIQKNANIVFLFIEKSPRISSKNSVTLGKSNVISTASVKIIVGDNMETWDCNITVSNGSLSIYNNSAVELPNAFYKGCCFFIDLTPK